MNKIVLLSLILTSCSQLPKRIYQQEQSEYIGVVNTNICEQKTIKPYKQNQKTYAVDNNLVFEHTFIINSVISLFQCKNKPCMYKEQTISSYDVDGVKCEIKRLFDGELIEVCESDYTTRFIKHKCGGFNVVFNKQGDLIWSEKDIDLPFNKTNGDMQPWYVTKSKLTYTFEDYLSTYYHKGRFISIVHLTKDNEYDYELNKVTEWHDNNVTQTLWDLGF